MSNRRIITLIYLLVVLNIMDASVTIMSINAGIAEEVNPIMAFFLEKHVLWFILVKFAAVFLNFGLWDDGFRPFADKTAIRGHSNVASANT